MPADIGSLLTPQEALVLHFGFSRPGEFALDWIDLAKYAGSSEA